MAMLAAGILVAAPVWAADLNHDGADDQLVPGTLPAILDEGDIAIADTGDGSVSIYINRLGDLGYVVTPIPPDSDLEVLQEYSLVILPVGHGSAEHYATFDGLAADYMDYVAVGGGLWVGQPNPFGMSGNQAEITWVPYYLFLHNGYNNADCPPVIVDPNHCITMDLPDTWFSFPADTVLEMGSEWDILVEGNATGLPGVLFAEYGNGKVLVELTHPSPGSICPIDDAALDRYVTCTMGGVVATEDATWSTVKTLYR
jgi:hypothetical protein